MARAEVDLKTLIGHNRDRILDLLDLGNTLIFDVKAEHRWTTHALETYSQLIRILGNVKVLLENTEQDWDTGEKMFETVEGRKLWKTVVALWRAVPPVRAKYTEMLARRRRQRIMDQEIVEVEEFDPEVIEQELETLNQYNDDLLTVLKEVKALSDKLPEGLAPKQEEEEPVAPAKAPEAAAGDDDGEPEDQPAEAADPEPEIAEEKPVLQKEGVVADDELSPV